MAAKEFAFGVKAVEIAGDQTVGGENWVCIAAVCFRFQQIRCRASIRFHNVTSNLSTKIQSFTIHHPARKLQETERTKFFLVSGQFTDRP
jgi:hypothetical protein